MRNTTAILGCAHIYLPVIFDVCAEVHGIKKFHVFKNIPVPNLPDMPVKHPGYTIKYHEPGDQFSKAVKNILFGVNGPFAKRKVYEYFKKKFKIEKSDYTTVISNYSTLSPTTECQKGVFIEPGCVISSQTVLGFGITVKRSVSIGHHCEVGAYSEINPGVTISGHVNVGQGVIIGSGAVLRNRITIGENSVIGMGSVVTKDVPPGVVAYGNPCKVIRKNKVRS